MPWIRLDDNFTEHPKMLEVGSQAAWLHLRAIAYCSRHLTDGALSERAVQWLRATRLLTDRLTSSGLWERNGNGYRIHDYLDYQPSRSHVLSVRKKRATAGARGGSK